jgi:hypothetical protein
MFDMQFRMTAPDVVQRSAPARFEGRATPGNSLDFAAARHCAAARTRRFRTAQLTP